MASETDPLVKKEEGRDCTGEEEQVFEEVPLWDDAKDIVVLAVPIFLSMLSFVGMKTTDTALLGHVSSDALAAAALSDLWTMCTAVLVQGRVLSVLIGSAVGAGNPKLAGIYLQVSYFALSFVLVFVVICWSLTETVWTAFGSDPVIAHMAGTYATILAVSLPGQLVFSQLTQFFSAQRILHPQVVSASVALAFNLIFGLIFVLGIPIPNWDGFGFVACPTVTTCMVYVQLVVVWYFFIHIERLHEAGWSGWSWKEITNERIKTFLALYVPAAAGMASDFWRVAVIGTAAAKLGEMEVAVFNTGYRVMWLTMIGVNALVQAGSIKMTQRLGRLNHLGAKQVGELGLYMSGAFSVVAGMAVVFQPRVIGSLFSNDPNFLDIFEEVRLPFTLTLILMNISVAIERIPYAMGRTKEVVWVGFVASWGAQVPGVLALTHYWRADLTAVYTGMAIGYGVLAILYGWIAFTSDWKKYALLARSRSEIKDD